jgi:diadenosine tetraphosphate (Ap4A) HIT family hydrolase
MGCLFCDWIKNNKHVLYKTEKNVVLIPNITWVKNCLLVCPIKHVESIYDLDEETYLEMYKIGRKLGQQLEKKDADATVYLLNNNHMQISHLPTHVAHLHLKIIPCYKKYTNTDSARMELSEEDIDKIKQDLLKLLGYQRM